MELIITRYVWEKLNFLKTYKDCEVGGFGIATDPDYPGYIDDFLLVPQKSSPVSVDWNDDDLFKFMSKMGKQKLHPYQYMRVWIHTHPGMGASPSMTDENTFKNTFSDCEWCFMFILGEDAQGHPDIYCRYKNNRDEEEYEVAPMIEYNQAEDDEIDLSTHEYWIEEFKNNVIEKPHVRFVSPRENVGWPYELNRDFNERFEPSVRTAGARTALLSNDELDSLINKMID